MIVRRVLPALLVVAALLAGTDSASAAAPWFVIVHGSLLDEPVLLDDWDENQELMLAITETVQTVRTDLDEVEGRQYLELALLWGPDWMDYPRDSEALGRLLPEEATQQGRLYPAVGSEEPALVLFEDVGGVSGLSVLRVVEPRALAILEAHGIPVRIESEGSSFLSGALGVRGAVLTLVVVGLLAVVLVARRRRIAVAIRGDGDGAA